MLPNFIVVGAMKAGTSAFLTDLNEHPEVCVADKELHFFNRDERYSGGLEFYRQFFKKCNTPAVGEKTPTYSYHPLVAERMHLLLPKVKLIWILREPVSRAYSHYNFFVGMGKERLSFEKAIDRELSGNTRDFTMRYLDRSIYVSQIKHYLEYFDQSQMLILLYEDYYRDRINVLTKTAQFLGINLKFKFSPNTKYKNLTYMPISQNVQWVAYHLFRKKGYRIYNFIRTLNRKGQPGYQSMDPDLMSRLTEYYSNYNSELSKLTGLDLGHWGSHNKP